jgi:hypothetical protein
VHTHGACFNAMLRVHRTASLSGCSWLAVAVDGTRVAISRCVTRIDPVLATRRELTSRVLLPRVSFANVRPRPHRGDSFDPLGVDTLTLPPTSPPHAGRWAVSASVEPFIVFLSDVRMAASRAHYSPDEHPC